jgi:hypothetical protein
LEPISITENRTGEDGEQDQEDHPAATAGAAPAETEIILQPIKQPTQQQQLQYTGQTAWTIIHALPPIGDHSTTNRA